MATSRKRGTFAKSSAGFIGLPWSPDQSSTEPLKAVTDVQLTKQQKRHHANVLLLYVSFLYLVKFIPQRTVTVLRTKGGLVQHKCAILSALCARCRYFILAARMLAVF